MRITYLGHSSFEIEADSSKILIDPFLVLSPNFDYKNVSDIFVTHGHSDHIGSAIEISKKTGAKITAIFELANYLASKGAVVNGINLGSQTSYSWGKAISVPAFHSSSTPEGFYAGCPCGYIFKVQDCTIYHAGDTCLNSEMKTIGEVFKPDIAMLPVGGQYTMDIEKAVIAAQWLKSNTIIPMHYNTFEAIQVDIKEFEKQIKDIGKKPLIMQVGESK